ncbi:MAG: DUF92 domain-containing protein [archaeon]
MQFPILDETVKVAIVLASLLFLSIWAYRKKSLDKEGVLFANIIGLLSYYLAGLGAYAVIVILFLVTEFSTRFGRRSKKVTYEKRNISNVLGNLGAPIISLVLGSKIAFFGAVSAALADTMSSEIGVTSKKPPVLLTDWSKKVEAGTDGGITVKGTLAAVAGSAIIAAISYYFLHGLIQAIIVFIAGVMGQFADSFFGAMFERKNKLSNTQVNFLGSASGALIAFALGTLI